MTSEVIAGRRQVAQAVFQEVGNMGRVLALVAVIACFGVLTGIALWDVGYWGILKPHFESWGAAQVFWDLVIMGLLVCIWMVRDGRERGVAVWPYVLVPLAAGSFGPLLYLLLREWRQLRAGG